MPLPVPELPEVMRIHELLEEAGRLQPEPAVFVTLTLPLPPLEEKLLLVGLMLYVQPGSGLLWVTVKVFPAMVMEPVLAFPVLASTL